MSLLMSLLKKLIANQQYREQQAATKHIKKKRVPFGRRRCGWRLGRHWPWWLLIMLAIALTSCDGGGNDDAVHIDGDCGEDCVLMENQTPSTPQTVEW